MPANGMNLMMMLERGSGGAATADDKDKKVIEKDKQIGKHVTKTTGEFDSLRNARRVEPIILKNKFEALHDGEDDDYAEKLNALTNQHDDDHYNNDHHHDKHNTGTVQWTKHKPNKRQRQRRREMCTMAFNDAQSGDCECSQQCCADTQKPEQMKLRQPTNTTSSVAPWRSDQ